MTTDTIVLASEKNAADAAGNLADTKPVSEDKQLTNGEDKTLETDEVEEETSETDEEAEATEEELEAKQDEPKPKKKGGFQKRIDKLNGRLSALEQEKEYWRQETLRTKTPEKQIETTSISDPSEPKEEDFTTVKEFYRAHSLWTVRQELLAEKQKEKESSIKTEFQTKASQHAERVKTLSAKKDDWDEVQDTFKRVPISTAVEQLILDAGENSAGLVYELGKNPEELDRICKMPYGQAARMLGKLEARLEKTSTPIKEEKQTKAPKPVTPVRTKGAAVPKGYRDNMTMKEYDTWRNEQSKGR